MDFLALLVVPLFIILMGLPYILFDAYQKWAEFGRKHERLGASTKELEHSVDALREAFNRLEVQNERIIGRLQNVETIVTSQAWDAMHEEREALGGGRQSSLGEASIDDYEAGGAKKAERLARRLQG